MTQAVAVNNDFYDALGELWFQGDAHAVALLRAEAKIKVRYARAALGESPRRVADIACGAGLVTMPLAAAGHDLVGIDYARGAIAAAEAERARRDPQALWRLAFAQGDALALDLPDASFDSALMLDFLEHTESPERALAEAARILRPGGTLVFHTFNRTPLAWLLAIHGIALLCRDTPEHVHVYRLFIKPDELRRLLRRHGFEVDEIRGIRPCLGRDFWQSLARRRVTPGFDFAYTRSLAVGYMGRATKRGMSTQCLGRGG
jgi:2-polyprenyl-6-hydroxyphenyl methylase/3-demethylubiquinone-9 3-methyltransferase